MLLVYKKSVGVLVARPTIRGSGIALTVSTSNAEAHACMYIQGYSILMSIYRYFVV